MASDLHLDHGDMLEIIILTEQNLSMVAKQTARSEKELLKAWLHAESLNRTCVIALRLWG